MRRYISPLFLPSLILIVAGLADSLYLLIKHYSYSAVACGLIQGCDTVLISSYATILGIPVALLGVLYYTAAFASLFLILWRPHLASRIYFAIVSFGFIFSVHFVYLQFRVIGQICQYCMVSAILTTLIFLCGIFIFKKPVTFKND